MRQKSGARRDSAERVVKDIRCAARKRYSADEKIRTVLDSQRGEASIAALCRHEGTDQNLYYRWSTKFLEPYPVRLNHSDRVRL